MYMYYTEFSRNNLSHTCGTNVLRNVPPCFSVPCRVTIDVIRNVTRFGFSPHWSHVGRYKQTSAGLYFCTVQWLGKLKMPTKRWFWRTCNSDSSYKSKEHMVGVTIHPFPKPTTELDRCERWIKQYGRPQNYLYVDRIKRHHYVCSNVCLT